MKTVTLYEITSRKVELVDSFTHLRTPGATPAHSLYDGDVLVGMRQQPVGAVRWYADGQYCLMSPELRARLEAPLLADFADDLEREREMAWRHFVGAPLWLRIWRALTC